MEMTLHPHRPLCCRTAPGERIRPALGSFNQSFPCCKMSTGVRSVHCIVASSDYSRRRPKKGYSPRTRGNGPKGFSPRPRVGTSTQKKDQNGSEEKEQSTTSSSVRTSTGILDEAEEHRHGVKDGMDGNMFMENKSETFDDDKDDGQRAEVEDDGNEINSTEKHLAVGCNDEGIEKGKVSNSDGVVTELKNYIIDEPDNGQRAEVEYDGDEINSTEKHLAVGCNDEGIEKGKVSDSDGVVAELKNYIIDEPDNGQRAEVEYDGDEINSTEKHLAVGCNDEGIEKGKVSNSDGAVTELKNYIIDEPDNGQRAEVEYDGDEINSTEKHLAVGCNDEGIEKGKVSNSDGVVTELKNYIIDEPDNGQRAEVGYDGDEINSTEKHLAVGCNDEGIEKGKVSNSDGAVTELKNYIIDEPNMEETLLRKEYMDAQEHKRVLEDLAKKNLSSGNIVFVYPQLVRPDQSIEVFLNRSLSSLVNENDVFIMGAFNGWRWKSFTERLQRTNLEGDWWSCLLYIPKEAYKIDFVFFNGGNVYENNDWKDFSVPVEGGMDAPAFEDFMLEEKRKELERLAAEQAERERQAEEERRKELERLAAEQAERERQAEEERRKESEKAAIDSDRAQAKLDMEKKRESLQKVMQLAKISDEKVWRIEPSVFKSGDRVCLFYNRSLRPLSQATEIWIHGGYNNWIEGLSIVERLLRSDEKDGDWWYAQVSIPDRALVVDWVFADGPPQKAKVYDNNNRLDFHAVVPKSISEELFWVEEEHRIFRKLQEERKVKQEAARRKAEKTARMKAETKERVLLSQKHIVYTEPLIVQAGTEVTLFYNPSNTVLSGKTEVWFRCSFNRWTHHYGALPPQKMLPSDVGSYLKVKVKVPLDAYMMDFVFSEKEDGGLFDNKYGMDYHIPVHGGIMKEPPMHIVHIAVEMAPIAKVGGLGDVVTSLSRAVQDLGHTVNIILPKYDCMNLSNVKDFHYSRSFFWSGTEIKVWFGRVEGLSVYFLEPQEGMFSIGCIYGRNDAARFGFFCHAALEYLLQTGSHPDILHCHDWSTAPVAWLFKEHYKQYGLSSARVVFTIHNLEFGAHFIGKAMTYSDKATTVSHTYSKEVSGNPAISPHLHKFHGILNGIDPDIWDPYNDNFIPVNYTSENVVEGKKAAKVTLQQKLGLRQSDHPLVGIITRLTVQKGIHLIKHAIMRTIERHGQVVLLGSAPDPRIQNEFVNLANQLHSSHADRVRLCLTYDEPLSHLIYAGSDFILVPSLFEPCGLTQLIAMRYGAIPVVRRTGGLYDTIFDVDNDKDRAQTKGLEPNGFSFEGTDSSGVDYALNRAITVWYDGREWFYSLCKRVMEQDWSWNRPALDYIELYYAAKK